MKGLFIVGCFAMLISGCSSNPKKTTQELRGIGEEKIVWQRPNPLPCWVDTPRCYDKKIQDRQYFLGIGKPEDYEDSALTTAIDAAGIQIAQNITKSVDWRKYFSESLINSAGFVAVRSFTDKIVGAQFARAIFKGQYMVTRATQRIQTIEYGVPRLHYRVYALVEIPNSVIPEALAASKEDLRQKFVKERDVIKKEQLKGNIAAIEAIEKEYSR